MKFFQIEDDGRLSFPFDFLRERDPRKKNIICWFSAGITSTLATKIVLEEVQDRDDVNVDIVFFETGSHHPDNERFIRECERWFGQKIISIQHSRFRDVFQVFRDRKYLNGVAGAPCTGYMKRDLRIEIEKHVKYDAQVFGFEFEKREISRAIRFFEQYPDAKPVFPLIERRYTKADAVRIIGKAGIEIPEMYKLGYSNNNCFAGFEKFITDKGVFSFEEKTGERVRVLNEDGWVEADIKSFGMQDTFSIEFENEKGEFIEVVTTLGHRWPTIDGFKTTEELRTGEKIRGIDGGHWKVVSRWLTACGVQEVYCATVIDGKPLFCLDGMLYTGNCVGCVKGGMGYWNKIRRDFPEVFDKYAKLEREIGASILKDKVEGGGYQKMFLDELDPNRGKDQKPITGECGVVCPVELQDIMSKKIEPLMNGEGVIPTLEERIRRDDEKS